MKSCYTLTIIASCLTLSLLLSGCNTTRDGFRGDHPVQRTEALTMDTVWFIDHDLNRTEIRRTPVGEREHRTVKVTIEQSGTGESDTGNLQFWALLRNRTDYDLQVEGRTRFFDANGVPLDDASAWKRVYLSANGTATYRESAVSQRATHYLVELREGR